MLALVTVGVGWVYLVRNRDTDSVPTFANLVQVTSTIGVEDYPTWSPDGRTLAYESDQAGNLDIWVTQGGDGASINRTIDHDGDDRFPVWSRDGRQIAFWSSQDGGGCFVMPTLAGPPRKIATSGHLGTKAGHSGRPTGRNLPAWSTARPKGSEWMW